MFVSLLQIFSKLFDCGLMYGEFFQKTGLRGVAHRRSVPENTVCSDDDHKVQKYDMGSTDQIVLAVYR